MSTREDLIAAKALIDTPAKLSDVGNGAFTPIAKALLLAVQGRPSPYSNMRDALISVSTSDLVTMSERPHADIMALFDRAIAAAGDA